MSTNNMKLETVETFTVRLACGFASTVLLVLLFGLLLLVVGLEGSSFAQESQPKRFTSPGEASKALFEAAQKEDEHALEAILGAGKEVTSSSDEVEDKLEREQFTRKYQEMHRLVEEPDRKTVLYIGAENWPFPIPLVSENGAWYFEPMTGSQEILFRRIGENETTAIEVCEEFALTRTVDDAKVTSDAKAASQDPITRFAQSLVTADADSNTHAGGNKESYLFHGYYFRRVTGSSAAGGGKKKGLALVAYPAEYRSSGVKTFIVTKKGIVFEKDLGPGTTTVAPAISVRSSGWRVAESGSGTGGE
jgi:hypothetical protein